MPEHTEIKSKAEIRLDRRSEPIREWYRKRILLCVLFLLIYFAAFGFYRTSSAEPFDLAVRDLFYEIRAPRLTPVMIAVTQLAGSRWIVAWIAVLLVIPKTRRKIGLPLGVTQLCAHILYRVLNTLIARPRPNPAMWLIDPSGFSFPSGHSLNGIVFYWMLVYLIRRAYGKRPWVRVLTTILMLMPFVVMFSRLYLGVHYLSDIVGGASLGISVMCAASAIFEKMQRGRAVRVGGEAAA